MVRRVEYKTCRTLGLVQISIRHLIHNTFASCQRPLKFGPVQNVHECIWFMPDGFGQDQISKTFWHRPNASPEKAMATYSSTLAWKIPWTEEPGRLWSMGSLGVRHNWATSLSLFTFMHWRKEWQPTPVFLPGESQGQGSLVGCHL